METQQSGSHPSSVPVQEIPIRAKNMVLYLKMTMWDFSIQTETRIYHNKPDIMLKNKKEKTWQI